MGSTLILEVLTFVAAIGNIIVLMAFLYECSAQEPDVFFIDVLFQGNTGVLIGLGIPAIASGIMISRTLKTLRKQLRLIKEGK